MHGKSARKVQGQFSKGDARYWMPKLFKWQRSANYSIQTQFRGQRVAFTLRTANKEVAAKRAAAIYEDLVRLGVDATLAKHRANDVKEPVGIATVGQWIEAARGVSTSNPATFAQYAASLRLIAGQILAVRKPRNASGPARAAHEHTVQASTLRRSRSFLSKPCNAGGWHMWRKPRTRPRNVRA